MRVWEKHCILEEEEEKTAPYAERISMETIPFPNYSSWTHYS